jgi:endonuclease YncB( thermonuclease family)
MRWFRAWARLCLAAAGVALLPASASAQAALMEPITGRARALQADQIVIGQQRISLFGIDAPDPDQDRECVAGRTYYGCFTNAKRALEILVDLGPITCTDTGVRNYVNFPYMTCKLGELDLAEDLVRDGWAFALRQQSDKYVPFEAQAKAAKKGMWQDGIRYTLPWEWREMNGRPLLGP